MFAHVPDAWVDESKTKVGYEISFTRYFYRYEPLRPLAEIDADIKALEGEILTLLAEHGGFRCLILEPTRELAAQVETAFRDYGRFTNLSVTVIHGGVGYGKQRDDIQRKRHIQESRFQRRSRRHSVSCVNSRYSPTPRNDFHR